MRKKCTRSRAAGFLQQLKYSSIRARLSTRTRYCTSPHIRLRIGHHRQVLRQDCHSAHGRLRHGPAEWVGRRFAQHFDDCPSGSWSFRCCCAAFWASRLCVYCCLSRAHLRASEKTQVLLRPRIHVRSALACRGASWWWCRGGC